MPSKIPVIAVLDVGKTNKKAFLFDQDYQIVYERSIQLEETVDEDGFPCEDVLRLREWVRAAIKDMNRADRFEVKAVNVSAYGASLVHIDDNGELLNPLYNYLKPYPAGLAKSFYENYGGQELVSLETASPALGNLNSGLQLYWLSKERSNFFTQVNKSLHLPQFIAWLITGQAWSDITSIGCHTLLWDFSSQNYHRWVGEEGLLKLLAPVFPSDSATAIKTDGHEVMVGVGLHDSSAALIPYLAQFHEPFLLLSTGTWNISLNPFSTTPLSADELRNDCLCYLDYKRNAVKASRLFAGNEHDRQAKRLADFYHVHPEAYRKVIFNPETARLIKERKESLSANVPGGGTGVYQSKFTHRELSDYQSFEVGYHQLMIDLTDDQVKAARRVMDSEDKARRIFVDGGFGQNSVFMNLLAASFPDKEVFAASLHQASALGAALAIHPYWNNNPVPKNLIDLKLFR